MTTVVNIEIHKYFILSLKKIVLENMQKHE